ncbi:60S ribosomal protein L32 [Zancudomyces culisetae]|uniref:60S ribosomal protein L32 n=1 Tax=Zancudomyces culisetae TaxID=1213189 RepID=A0A1R1PT94_ZANCU|nr:60S ribosomal protein L32 [Zancudomyces culisetae]|eukprot:OMH84216.1 60S ribosomal protein L32 [Zancudomyces culisetae]
MAKPIKSIDIVKKRTKKFVRVQSDRFMRVGESWRKPRGIDSRTRRRFKGTRPQPKIGYGSNNKTKNLLPSGFRLHTVNNVSDLKPLIMLNRKYCVEIASSVCSRKRIAIVNRAKELDINVINASARVRTEAN